MVKPQEEKEVGIMMLEDRLAEKFDTLQLAREQRNHIVFDEIARSIEVLLRVIPSAYNLLLQDKATLEQALIEQLDEIEGRAQNAPNKISADSIRNNEAFQAQWDYRELYEEIIIDLMQRFKLVPIRYPMLSEVQAPEKEEAVEPPVPTLVPEPPQQKIPTPTPTKKPKLSIPKQVEEFEV